MSVTVTWSIFHFAAQRITQINGKVFSHRSNFLSYVDVAITSQISATTLRQAITMIDVKTFVRSLRAGSSLLWTPALRPLYRSSAPAQGDRRE